MIISKTPARVTLGGGGTDLPQYYTRFGCSLVTATVDKHIYVMAHRRWENIVWVGYHHTEIVDNIEKIQHRVVRAALKMLGITSNIQIVSMADVPSEAGLGSSSTFTVGLLNTLHTFKGENTSPKELAEEAYYVERILLKEPGGKQDQYSAAYGGINCLNIDRLGRVTVVPLKIPKELISELENNLLYFYTGIRRRAPEVQVYQKRALEKGDQGVIENLHQISKIGLESKRCLVEGDFHRFGELLHEHWLAKRGLGKKISNPTIDKWYDLGIRNGALGGKIIGAGGGGFLMFYCEGDGKAKVRKAMFEQGLEEVRFRFEFSGSKILLNL